MKRRKGNCMTTNSYRHYAYFLFKIKEKQYYIQVFSVLYECIPLIRFLISTP